MSHRRGFQPEPLAPLEGRIVMKASAAAATLGNVGVLGDSYSDEYQFYPKDRYHARNWVEILAATKKAGFGTLSKASRGEPRNQGYEYDWARSDATSVNMVANQLPGLTAQVAAGKIKYVSIFVGGNDFLDYFRSLAATATTNPPTADQVQSSVAALQAQATANVTTAVGTLLAANPNVKVVVTTIPSLAFTPIVRQGVAALPEAAGVVAAADAAIANFNASIKLLASANPRVAVSDLAATANAAAASTVLPYGGTTVNLTTTSNAYQSFFLADGLHVGTIGQGVIANGFIQAVDTTFGARVSLINPTQIVSLARQFQNQTRRLP